MLHHQARRTSAASKPSRLATNNQDVTNEYFSPSSSNRAHRRMVQRHRGVKYANSMDPRLVSYIDASSSRPSSRSGQYRQYDNYNHTKQMELQRQQRHDELLDDLLESDDNKPRKRRVKRSSSGQSSQHVEILVFIRVFVSVILLSAVLCIAVAVLFSMLYSIPSYISSLFGSSNSEERAQLDKDFVQNTEEIRHLLELARTQYDALSKDNNALHSVRTEESLGLFEMIPHPGNPNIHLSVPRFYASVSVGGGDSPTINRVLREFTDGKMLTPELTSTIGSFSDDESDLSQRTIFVSILSSGGGHCSTAVTNILSTAFNPERVRIAIVDVADTESLDYFPCDEPPRPCDSDPYQILCKLNLNVDVYELKSDRDAGAIFSRHIANRMYRGEYYALQVGYAASVAFSLGWDEELIQQFEATSNEMAILTTYLSDATLDREMVDALEARPERITLCHASFEGVMPNRRLMHLRRDQPEQVPSSSRRDRPILQPYWSSELSFSRGHFLLNVPYDRHACGVDKQDEEMSMVIRAFTHGYDFYTPTKSVIFRYSQNDDDKKHRNQSKQTECSSAAAVKSRHRLEKLVTPNSREVDSDVSGLGSVRTSEQFDRCFGIHMKEHITEQRLCEFVVSGNMHDEFVPHLRSNGMGIDYKNINFRFHELISIHKDSEKMS